MKVAFDFDSTLMFPAENPEGNEVIVGAPNEEFVAKARKHIQGGDKVYIVTSRNESDYSKKQILKFVLNNGLRIPPARVFHTNQQDKGEFIHNNNLQIELLYDDDPHELQIAAKYRIKGENAYNDAAKKADKDFYGLDEGKKKNKTFKTFIRPIALDEDELEEGSKGLKRQMRKKVSYAKKHIPKSEMTGKQIETSFRDAFNTAQEMNKKGGGTTTVYHMIMPGRLEAKGHDLEDAFKFLFSKSPKEISVSVDKGVWNISRSIVLEGEGKLTSYFDTDVYTTIDDYGNKVPLEPYRDTKSHDWDEGTVRLSDVEWDNIYLPDEIPYGWRRELDELIDQYDLNEKHHSQASYGGAMSMTYANEEDIKELEQEIMWLNSSLGDKETEIDGKLRDLRKELGDDKFFEVFEPEYDALSDMYEKIVADAADIMPERFGQTTEEFIEELQSVVEQQKELQDELEKIESSIEDKVDELEDAQEPVYEKRTFKSFMSEQETELTESEKLQQAVMKDPKFQAWFKGSKTLDANGNPMVMFHGTQSDEHFTVFSIDGVPFVEDDDADEEAIRDPGSGADPNAFMGAHFAQEPEVASKFAIADVDWLRNRSAGRQGSGRVYPVFLNIKNPAVFQNETELNDFIYSRDIDSDYVEHALMDLQEDGNDYDELVDEYENNEEKKIEINMYAMSLANNMDDGMGDVNHPVEYARDLGSTARSELIRAGYDGVKYKNDVEGGISWIAFQPNQIKSALSSAYTDDPDITKESLYESDRKVSTPSQLIKYIDRHTNGALNYSLLRKYLNKSKYYILSDVPLYKLNIQDEDLVSYDIKSPFESDLPIVIDNDYFVVDGRHRAVNAKNKGEKTISAWIPHEILKEEKYKKYISEDNKSVGTFKKFFSRS